MHITDTLHVFIRYRVAEIEWIQDIFPVQGTREREDVSIVLSVHPILACFYFPAHRESDN